MYPPPRALAEYSSKPQTRPYILCEYEHAMGNSSGDMWSYWNLIYSKPYLQGAYIWDWVDQALRQPQGPLPKSKVAKVKRGEETFWAYGGDFGPKGTPSDDNFNNNGLVSPDRKPHPGLSQVKHVYQYIQARPTDRSARSVEIHNRYDFINLKDLVVGSWKLKGDGREVQKGSLAELDLSPGAKQIVEVPLRSFDPAAGVEYIVELSFKLKKDQPWAKAGHEVAWQEFVLPDNSPALPENQDRLRAPTVTQASGRYTIVGENFVAIFDRSQGGLVSYRFKETELVLSPLRPDFWRAQTDNDRGRDMLKAQGIWREAHKDAKITAIASEIRERSVVMRLTLTLPKIQATWSSEYDVQPNGEMVVRNTYKPGRTNLPPLVRCGMQMTLPTGFERVTWLGPGPVETYSDRKHAKVGMYSGTVEEQFCDDYTEPGETGNKADARWIALQNRDGVGLLVIGQPLLSANALHYTAEDLNSAKHPFELRQESYVCLNLDLVQQGVGGDDSWGAWPHPEFLIPNKQYEYGFRLRPFSRGEDLSVLSRSAAPKR
jgi:beta-galactosidase